MAPFYRGFEVKPKLNQDDIKAIQVKHLLKKEVRGDFNQGLLDLDGRNSQKYLHQTQADF